MSSDYLYARPGYAIGPNEGRANNHDGLADVALRSQEEVADIMGLTKQRVQQIEREALVKIRRRMRAEIREWRESYRYADTPSTSPCIPDTALGLQ